MPKNKGEEKMNKRIFFIFLCLSLAGCTFIPHYNRPVLHPCRPNSHTLILKHHRVKASASDIGWQEFFKDPRLQKLIELALENNRDYRVALLNVKQIQDQYRIVQYAFLPTF